MAATFREAMPVTDGNPRAVTFIRVPAHSPERTAAYEEWYDNIHIPVRLSMPGFLGAQRYDTLVGEQRYFVFYELDEATVVTGERYVNQRAWERSQPPDSFEAPALTRPGFERGFYDQIGGPEWPDPNLKSAYVHVLGLHPDEDSSDTVARYLLDDHAARTLRIPGVLAVRTFTIARMSVEAGTGMHGDYPRLLSVAYIDALDVAGDPLFVAARDSALDISDTTVDNAYVVLGKCVYSAEAPPSSLAQSAPPQEDAIR